MIQVHVSDHMMMDGVSVYISDKHEGIERRILRFGETGNTWETPPDPTMVSEPTFRVGSDEARALLDALLRFYQGASDMHTARADLLHERGRVDKLTSGLMQIAIQASGSGWPSTTPPERQP